MRFQMNIQAFIGAELDKTISAFEFIIWQVVPDWKINILHLVKVVI